MSDRRCIDVIAGALCDGPQVLIAQRPPGKHMAGGWEFPGGKLDPGEQSLQCLKRELKEELNVDVQSAEWLSECTHDYPDRRVRIELWLVNRFEGNPMPNEGQTIKWVDIDKLHLAGMLPADEPLVRKLQAYYAIKN